MRLTTKGRYAVTAMLDLAFHSQKNPVTLTDIATRQTISLSYLEQLFARLRKAGMVTGVRGPGGGYKLSRDASLINIADVIEAVDEQLDSTKCGGEANCQNNKACLTHDLWMGLSDQIRGYLQGISLGDLLEKHHVKEVAKRQEMDAKVIELHRMDRCQSLYK
ncbi:MAG: Rrf2 family transcriptional regulator [Methylicorpusculum sp.]|uniref:Rrf2 family transcriptional regulator n=2 Tax=Methylicorpusculum sp. TaxID=2713644 RepID=UPI0027267CE5|nr:Rrf2 family transcriptional regulator [Methylicorpusculum sp.]MDO8843260.1 Rrf2 family transcriptional regulator [Methylicorpusculum sp.]MDO8941037.1 Rrf2 family transcriptional regulator [Methylicorpusculum sp.]MDO9238455.1 Rrf2 family transcriptional regulator [Methylicorpusculum sp.]MDP2204304.1 Rrf2 family transcriptional regulator [Methylicorpusculum sp.]